MACYMIYPFSSFRISRKCHDYLFQNSLQTSEFEHTKKIQKNRGWFAACDCKPSYPNKNASARKEEKMPNSIYDIID